MNLDKKNPRLTPLTHIIMGAILVSAPVLFLESQGLIDITTKEKVIQVQKIDKDINYDNPTTNRAIAVAGHLTLQGQPLNNKSRKYVNKVEKEIEQDIKDLMFYSKFSAITGTNHVAQLLDDTTISIYSKWEVKFSHSEAQLLKQFPTAPFLAVNHEIIKKPNCLVEDDSFIYWGKATRHGEIWEEAPVIWDNKETNEWLIKFDDITPLNERAFNRRLLIIAGCKTDENIGKTTDNSDIKNKIEDALIKTTQK
jgi:hypothetical protein